MKRTTYKQENNYNNKVEDYDKRINKLKNVW